MYVYIKLTQVYVYLLELVFSFSLEKYPEVELLSHMVVLLLIF